MMTADLALAILIDRTSAYYDANAPAYMTYIERTHVSAPSLGRSQEINRSVAVRIEDNFAVMKDLPNGSERTGQAFPIVAYFDPFSAFRLSWYANLKRVDIDLQRGQSFELQTPAPDSTVNVVVPYNSYWAARYAPDSTESAQHFLIDPTPRVSNGYYPSEVIEDPQTQLPSHIEMRVDGSDESIALDFKVIDGHWVIDHGTWEATQHFAVFTSKVIADVTFESIAFPTQAPDPRLAGTPMPTSSPTL
jgi:hypothetical protein